MKNNLEPDNLLETFCSIDFEGISKHPNILIAAAFWDRERFEAARIAYRFMRYIDDRVDSYKTEHLTISREEQAGLADDVRSWTDMIRNRSALTVDQQLVRTWEKFLIPDWPVEAFARAMIYDIHHQGFPTFDSFLDYAEGASVAPAGIFVHLCGLRFENGMYLPPVFDAREVARPCAIFSYLVHIIRDFQKDRLEHLNYFPSDMLQKFGLDQATLDDIAQGGPIPDGFRELVREYMRIADKYRLETLRMIEKVCPLLEMRYRLSLEIIFNLYLMVYHRIEPEKGLFTTEALHPSTDQIKEQVLNTIKSFDYKP